jgi:hypothetical protein
LLTLAQLRPRSFVSGAPANLREVLKTYNRTEFHHIYPRAYLLEHAVDAKQINCLANFALVSAADNKVLGGVAPSEYKPRMAQANLDQVLESAAVPQSIFSDDFELFLRDRSELLTGICRQLASIKT